MKILSIDTSCNTCQVALTDGEKMLGSYKERDKRTHSVKLLPAIEKLVNDNGLVPSDIDMLCVTNGPGSYTGMRIGVSTAKAISFGTGAPLVGINTLDFLAMSANSANSATSAISANSSSADCDFSFICSLINARNERVYSCIYSKELKRMRDCTAGELSECLNELKDILPKGGKVLFCGDGAVDYKDIICNTLGDACLFANDDVILGRPEIINKMAEEIYENEDDKDKFSSEKLVIDYLRSYLQEK